MALVVAVMAVTLLLALGTALVLTTSVETAIAGNVQVGEQARYAAVAIVTRTLADLRTADWDAVLSGAGGGTFTDGAAGNRTLADGRVIDLRQIANLIACGHAGACADSEMNAVTATRPWGPNNPRWRLFAHGTLGALVGEPDGAPSFYVAALVADDGGENDGDPFRDGMVIGPSPNPGRGVMLVRGEAYGPRGAHRVVEATVARERTDEADPASPWRVHLRRWRDD